MTPSTPALASRRAALVLLPCTVLMVAGAAVGGPDALGSSAPDQRAQESGAAWLALLPEGEVKRRFILDCTGCHVWTEDWVRGPDGAPRTREEWAQSIQKMIGAFGQASAFPIISSWPEPEALAEWLHEGFAGSPGRRALPDSLLPGTPVRIDEFPVPNPGDLPHDLMVSPEGEVLITGMFTHQMYRLDPASGTFTTVSIPVPNANPRALDIDTDGRWVVLLGGPGAVARYTPASESWEHWAFGAYPHSVVAADDGRIWWNGHFTVDPELIGALDPASGDIEGFHVPALATSDTPPGESTVPYGLRAAPDGTIWATQLRGGHLIRLDPASGEVRQWPLPTDHSGPRRPDVAPDGTVWIPEYAAGKLARFDPETESFTEWDLPVPDALPYVVRVDQSNGRIWIGTGHGDLLASFDPDRERFTLYPLPTRGALVRHIDVDEARGEIWAAYGASPGGPSKVARLRTAVRPNPTD